MLRLLHIAVLWFAVLPLLLCDNLHCFYSPITEKEKTSEFILTECPPDELCFKADGRYGNYSALSARGCIVAGNCSQVHSIRLKGTIYSMSYGCCDWSYCNSHPEVTAKLISIIVALLTVAMMTGSL